MKKKGKFTAFICAVTLGVTALAFASISNTNKPSAENDSDGIFTPSINATPSQNEEVSLLSGDIYTVCANYTKLITQSYNPNKIDKFAPTPLTISWQTDEEALYYTLKLSTNSNMTDAQSFVTFDSSVILENLFMGTKYFYRIYAKYEDKIIKSRIFEFSTAYLPRTIYVDDNVSNTRDWGGYYTIDKTHRVKQGIVYRGGALETITENGKHVMLDVLKIKTDLDVRGDTGAGNSSPLGKGVNYVETKGPYYLGTTGIDQPGDYRKALITEIKTFANPDNFPIYVHCSLGRDRTGTLCFLINALLGVNELDLYRDYEISIMSRTGRLDNQNAIHMVGSAFTSLYNYIKYYSYGTLAENTEKYMLDIGITAEEITAIKTNMLEEVK